MNYSLVTLLLSVFIALLGIGIIVPIMPVFAAELGAGGFWLGMIIASFSLARALFQPITGNYSDRFGRKPFMLTGLAIYALVGVCLPLAQSISDLIIIRAIHGVGSAMIVPMAMAYMGALAPEGHEGRYMSLLNIAIFAGIGCGPLLGGVFSDFFSMASGFYAMSVLSLTASVMVVLLVPEQKESGHGAGKRLALGEMLKKVSQNQKTLGILLARFSTMIFIVPTMAFLPLLVHRGGFGEGIEIGLIMGARTLVNAFLQVPFGRLADSWSKERLLLSSSLLTGLMVVCVPFANGFIPLLLLFMAIGFGEAVIWPVLGAYATQQGRDHYGYGSMMGVFNLAMSLGVFSGAMISGISMDMLGLNFAFYISGFVVALFTALSLIMIRNA